MEYYNVHNIVGVCIDDSYPWVDTLNNDLPRQFRCDESLFNNCKSHIYISYKRDILKTNISVERLCVQGNSFIDKMYGVKVFFFENDIEIATNQECNEWFMFILYYSLSKNGYAFIHAAALEKDGSVLVIPSAGGTGKTILTLKLIKDHGYKLLGDDLCIASKGGHVFSYPKNMVIYPWHYEFLDESTNKSTKKTFVIGAKTKEIIKSKLRRYPKLLAYLRRRNPSLSQVQTSSILGDTCFCNEGFIKEIAFLERIENDESYTKNQLLTKIYVTTRHELFHYFDSLIDELLRNYNIIDGQYLYNSQFDILNSVVESCLLKTVSIPKTTTNKEFVDLFFKKIS